MKQLYVQRGVTFIVNWIQRLRWKFCTSFYDIGARSVITRNKVWLNPEQWLLALVQWWRGLHVALRCSFWPAAPAFYSGFCSLVISISLCKIYNVFISRLDQTIKSILSQLQRRSLQNTTYILIIEEFFPKTWKKFIMSSGRSLHHVISRLKSQWLFVVL